MHRDIWLTLYSELFFIVYICGIKFHIYNLIGTLVITVKSRPTEEFSPASKYLD